MYKREYSKRQGIVLQITPWNVLQEMKLDARRRYTPRVIPSVAMLTVNVAGFRDLANIGSAEEVSALLTNFVGMIDGKMAACEKSVWKVIDVGITVAQW